MPVELVRKPIKHLHLTVYPPTGRVRVSAPDRVSDDEVRAFVASRIGWVRRKQELFASQEHDPPPDRADRARLGADIARLVARWEPVIGVRVAGWTQRHMTSRWGSCNIRRRTICFNTELANRPLSCLEYVVVHEMVHLLSRRHDDRFRAHMDRFMPDWRLRRTSLNERKVPHSAG